MSSALPPLMQESGVPFDVFIQTLTEQLDKAQASMALKARGGKPSDSLIQLLPQKTSRIDRFRVSRVSCKR